jgi:hypothetical protein
VKPAVVKRSSLPLVETLLLDPPQAASASALSDAPIPISHLDAMGSSSETSRAQHIRGSAGGGMDGCFYVQVAFST